MKNLVVMDIEKEEIDDKNFMFFAMTHYRDKHSNSYEDFQEDLTRFKHLKKLLNRYQKTNVLKERLILNHIIIIYNCFETKAATQMLLYQVDPSQWYILKPFLLFLKYIREDDLIHVTLDENVVERLRKI